MNKHLVILYYWTNIDRKLEKKHKRGTVEPLNNGHIGGRDFVRGFHYWRSTIFLLIISPIITFQWLNESMRVRGFQINRCLHDTLALSIVNRFEHMHFACVCTKIIISFIILESTGTQQVSIDLTKIAFPYEGSLLPSNYWHSEENQFSIN